MTRLRGLILIAALLVVSALMLRASSRQPSELNAVDRLLLRLSSPIEAGFSAAARGGGRAFHTYLTLVNVNRDNLRLAEENHRLQAELGRLRLAHDQVARLEKLLDLRSQVAAETMTARVIGVETSAHYRVIRLRLDRGTGEVKPGMVVLVPEGVVGRVHRVYGDWCDVMLVVDADSSVDVRLTRSAARGVLKGMPGGEQLHIPQMPRAEDAQSGDEVVTSGIGGFPRELAVGRVIAVEKPDSGLWQRVVVEPAVDFGRLTEVLIVLAAPPPPDPETGRKVPEPRRGLMAPR